MEEKKVLVAEQETKPMEQLHTSGDDVIDDLVNDLEMECGYAINPAIFAL